MQAAGSVLAPSGEKRLVLRELASIAGGIAYDTDVIAELHVSDETYEAPAQYAISK